MEFTRPNKIVNYVEKGSIHAENISREKKHQTKNLKKEFTFSPHNCTKILFFEYL